MDEMNNHEVDYRGYHLIINVVGKRKVCGFELTILSVSIKKRANIIHLGNFYTKFPQLVSENYMKKFAKNLIDNVDEIIFKNNRYIGTESMIIKNLSPSFIETTLGEIYSEFLKLSKKSRDYIKYSRFLELYFHGHSIPDSIKKLYLEKHSKNLLGFNDIDSEIRNEFSGNISELKDEYENEYKLKRLERLNNDLEYKEEEISLLSKMIDKVKSVLNIVSENDKINASIDEFESKLKELSFFDKSRKKIKKTLNELVSSLNIIDIEKERNELFEMYKDYASIYKDTHGLLMIFDNLSLDDVMHLLDDIYRVKEKSYNNMIIKRDKLNYELSLYKDNEVDISDLYERLESK